MKSLSLAASVLLASLPLAALVSGCGGGDGGLIGSTPTPRATATTTATTAGTSTPTGSTTATHTPGATPTLTAAPSATSAPTATPTGTATQFTAPFTLSSGQSATLNASISGNKITGTLVVPNDAAAANFKVRQAIIIIPKGTYPFSGTLTAPRSYSVTGTTSEGSFTVSGLLPTTTQTGTYSLTYFGRTDTGTIPKLK